jgi:CheY-like chemotaxis protein
MVSRGYHISAVMSLRPQAISTSPVSVAALIEVASISKGGKQIRNVPTQDVPKQTYVPDLVLSPTPPSALTDIKLDREYVPSTGTGTTSQHTNERSEVTERSTKIQQRRNSPEKQPRRRIFTGYWDRKEGRLPAPGSPMKQPQQHQPPTQDSLSTRMAHPIVDICQYSPSPDYQSLRKHHALLESILQQSGKIPSTRSLPPLPEPLRRLRSESISSKSCGMYPLVSPVSILRKSKYVRRPLYEEEKSEDLDGQETSATRFARPIRNSDMKQSLLSVEGNLSQFARPASESNVHDIYLQLCQKAHQAKRSGNSKSVHFDPRIVITEFDDHVKREWYREHELLSFKSETIMLAHQYVLLNPQVAADFSKDSFDPITGKAKKNALYSLPVLNSLPEDFDPETFNKQLDAMLDQGVKRILVVDPNQAILQLFRKSILRIFPNAAIETVETAEDALRKYTMAIGNRRTAKKENRSFDIMIVEENLYNRNSKKKRGATINARAIFQKEGQTASLSRLHSLSDSEKTPPNTSHKQASFSALENVTCSPVTSERRGMSGSQLIKRIRQLEDQAYGGSETSDEQNFRGVIIGVSANLERDAKTLEASGADRIWSKPPPPMGIALRNQLLSALISKRKGGCTA